MSTLLGLVSLGLALLAFEKVVQEINKSSGRYLNEQFLELKFYTTTLRSIACSKDLSTQDAENKYFDFRNLDGLVSPLLMESDKPLTPPTNWQRNPHLDAVIAEVTKRFEDMNRVIQGANEKSVFSLETRVKLALIALLLAIVAISLSIGEASYQFWQAKGDRGAG